MDTLPLEERINAILPQTQCSKCGHPGCRPYARAIAEGEPINRCPPGGAQVIAQLAELLATPVLPLDPDYGTHGPRLRAYIREDECIGCTKCIQVCPTDAILGGPKRMHTVIETECTGCDLCVAPCPVDCIDMLPARTDADPATWRQRHEFRQQRLQREQQVRAQRKATRATSPATDTAAPAVRKTAEQLRQDIEAAVARAQARKAALGRDRQAE
jgi:Na+-translocating ferredoxin:NAD+ oxidoreductase subunit B